jgi:hypothetical protein
MAFAELHRTEEIGDATKEVKDRTASCPGFVIDAAEPTLLLDDIRPRVLSESPELHFDDPSPRTYV